MQFGLSPSDHVSKKLFQAGAKDVWTQPIHMKKNRPAVTLSALASLGDQENLTRLLVTETTTLGVRIFPCSRLSLERQMCGFETPYGVIQVKYGLLDGRVLNAHPEYDDCVKVSNHSGLPLKEVFAAVEAAVEVSREGGGLQVQPLVP